MTTFRGLPLYRVTLANEGDGVFCVSLVDDPAVESNFEYFGKKAPVLYAVENEEKRLVRGVVLRADFPIFRRDYPEDPGYYVTFGKDVIRQAAERFLSEGHADDVNTQHLAGSDVDGVNLVQLFIKDTAAGCAPEGFDEIADGSLFAEYHVTNDEVWDQIKAGTFKGFSVEIFYTLVPADEVRPSEFDRIVDLISENMDKKPVIKSLLALLLGTRKAEKFGSVTTDKGVLFWDGDEDLKAGDRVQMDDADGNRVEAPDGDYTTGDNKVIVVADGAVSEIRDSEAEVASEDPEQMARQRAAKFEESYNEKERKIADAIRAARADKGEEYGYLADAGDDFGVWAHYGEDTDWQDKFVRYAITWSEDGNATASDPVECRLAFVPMDFDDAAAFKGSDAPTEEEVAEAMSRAQALVEENAQLKAQVAALKKTSASLSAHKRFSVSPATQEKSPAGARLAKYLKKI